MGGGRRWRWRWRWWTSKNFVKLSTLIEVDETIESVLITILDEGQVGQIDAEVREHRRIAIAQLVTVDLKRETIIIWLGNHKIERSEKGKPYSCERCPTCAATIGAAVGASWTDRQR